MSDKLFPLIVVLGPTGAGKSDLALALAGALAGEVVSCDSIQVYRGVEIGSAKLPLSDRHGIPHHLIDVIDIDADLTAGAYARLAREAIGDIQSRKKLPVVVGGTGFYLRALLEGLSPAPGRDEVLRTRLTELAQRRPGALHRFLRRRDQEAARRIHPNDFQKLIRAIEICIAAQQPASDVQRQPRDAMQEVAPLKLGLNPDRALLYQKLNARSLWMFEHGLLDETEKLLASHPDTAKSKALQSLGYKQAVHVLNGSTDYQEAVQQLQSRTRQYAKRQLTWFRREPNVTWLKGFGSDYLIQEKAIQYASEFLREYPM